MRKIKFKTEYVPLSDDAINRHKDFDQLMSAYVTAPKPNWFKKFIQNKWTMFGGGLLTGAIVTSLLWYNQNSNLVNEAKINEANYPVEIQSPQQQQAASKAAEQMDMENAKQGNLRNEENEIADQVTAGTKTAVDVAATPQQPPQPVKSEKQAANSSAKNNGIATAGPTKDSKEVANIADDETKASPTVETVMNNEAYQPAFNDKMQPAAATAALSQKSEANETDLQTKDTFGSTSAAMAIGPPEYVANTAVNAENSKESKPENAETKVNLLPETAAVIAAAPDLLNNKDHAAEKNNSRSKKKNNAEKQDAASIQSDALENDTTAKAKKGWLVFGKNNSTKDEKLATQQDTAVSDFKVPATENQDTIYQERYAQVSFFTPISSNGIEGYKYVHWVSLNILQGYNGALKGVEFGGLLNGLKGYANGAQFGGLGNFAGGYLKGAQFAGLANYTGGYVKGAQFAGLANVGESLQGAQFAGITNVSRSTVSGFQAAGIANLAMDTLSGTQVAGIVNVLTTEHESKAYQIAGIGNLSLAESKGAQVSGIFNVANKIKGGQIGLINFGKNVDGFQIGLINVSDSMKGAAVGLISVSSNGIFDIAAWSSDFLTFNGAIRVGTPNVYNIFAYGVSPFNADLPFGFGVGIGGHIPIKRAFIDIDGMAWSMHRSYVSFARVNMINTLRVMGGFTFNKYLSVFAGPTLNVSVQDNRYDTFLPNYFYQNISANTTVRLAPGFVVGIHVF